MIYRLLYRLNGELRLSDVGTLQTPIQMLAAANAPDTRNMRAIEAVMMQERVARARAGMNINAAMKVDPVALFKDGDPAPIWTPKAS